MKAQEDGKWPLPENAKQVEVGRPTFEQLVTNQIRKH